MKKKQEKIREVLRPFFLIGICVAFSSSVALAQGRQPVVPEHAFAVSPSAFFFLYEEPDIDVQLDGYMYGVTGRYTYHKKAMLSTSIEYSRGDLDYEGFTWGGDPVTGDTDDWLLEWRGLLGLDLPIYSNLLTPFVGIGYRYWNNKGEGVGFYQREITYWYSPIGIAFFGAFSDTWTYGISGEYDFFWHGKAETDLGDVVFGYPALHSNFSQGDGYGLRGSLWIKVQLAKRFAVCVEPYVRYWDIDDSDIEELTYFGMPTGIFVMEPANRTTRYGLLLNLIF